MLSALSVVREKELGSILNLYVTPVTKLEFLLGKQLPYIALGMVNFFLVCALAVSVFGQRHDRRQHSPGIPALGTRRRARCPTGKGRPHATGGPCFPA